MLEFLARVLGRSERRHPRRRSNCDLGKLLNEIDRYNEKYGMSDRQFSILLGRSPDYVRSMRRQYASDKQAGVRPANLRRLCTFLGIEIKKVAS